MAIEAGKLRHRITIQAKGMTQDPVTGEMTQGWSDLVSVWASVGPLSTREFIAASAGQSEITARIVIRYRDGLDSTMRAIHRGKIYEFAGPPLADPNSGLEYLTIPAKEGVRDG